MVSSASKRALITHLKSFALSERRSCQLAGFSRYGYRYQAKSSNDDRLRSHLLAMAAQYPRYGYLMLHNLLKAEGLVINRKRTYRLYTEKNLQVRTKKRKELTRPRQPMVVPIKPNIRWSMDFVSDQLANGRRFRVLNVVHSREVLGQLADFSLSGLRVSRFLTDLIRD